MENSPSPYISECIWEVTGGRVNPCDHKSLAPQFYFGCFLDVYLFGFHHLKDRMVVQTQPGSLRMICLWHLVKAPQLIRNSRKTWTRNISFNFSSYLSRVLYCLNLTKSPIKSLKMTWFQCFRQVFTALCHLCAAVNGIGGLGFERKIAV